MLPEPQKRAGYAAKSDGVEVICVVENRSGGVPGKRELSESSPRDGIDDAVQHCRRDAAVEYPRRCSGRALLVVVGAGPRGCGMSRVVQEGGQDRPQAVNVFGSGNLFGQR
jgi:hypothetical protein